MDIILYSNNCPRCKILKTKLDQKNIQYNVFSDIDKMVEMGMKEVPILQIGENMFSYNEAIKYITEMM